MDVHQQISTQQSHTIFAVLHCDTVYIHIHAMEWSLLSTTAISEQIFVLSKIAEDLRWAERLYNNNILYTSDIAQQKQSCVWYKPHCSSFYCIACACVLCITYHSTAYHILSPSTSRDGYSFFASKIAYCVCAVHIYAQNVYFSN